MHTHLRRVHRGTATHAQACVCTLRSLPMTLLLYGMRMLTPRAHEWLLLCCACSLMWVRMPKLPGLLPSTAQNK